MTIETDRLERVTEQSRDRVAMLLDELRAKATPGDIVNHVIGHGGEGAASEILDKLGEQVRANPLPVLLVGAGIAWLMMGSKPSAESGAAKPPRAASGDGTGTGWMPSREG